MTLPLPQFVPYWGDDENIAVTNVLSNSDYLNEHETVRRFEKEFAQMVGSKYCAAVTSGTAALHVASRAALDT